MKHKPHVSGNTYRSRRHYETDHRRHSALPVLDFLFKYKKKWWYVEIVKFHVVDASEKV